LSQPAGVVVDPYGNLFIADTGNNLIREVSASGASTIVAGGATLGFSGDGGPATAGELWSPSGIAVDASGNHFIPDTNNNVIRKVAVGRQHHHRRRQ
jgi:DNA-binding beta-propeller fold protein YncE